MGSTQIAQAAWRGSLYAVSHLPQHRAGPSTLYRRGWAVASPICTSQTHRTTASTLRGTVLSRLTPHRRVVQPSWFIRQNPLQIAESIENALGGLRQATPVFGGVRGEIWETQGQLIFCKICMFMRSSHVLVADVTTLNFNLMYEIGFAIGLGVPIVPDEGHQLPRSTRPILTR